MGFCRGPRFTQSAGVPAAAAALLPGLRAHRLSAWVCVGVGVGVGVSAQWRVDRQKASEQKVGDQQTTESQQSTLTGKQALQQCPSSHEPTTNTSPLRKTDTTAPDDLRALHGLQVPPQNAAVL